MNIHSRGTFFKCEERKSLQKHRALPQLENQKILGFSRSFLKISHSFLPLKTRMNTAIQCIILLVCTAVCTSQAIIRCKCVRTSPGVNPSLIADVKAYNPRPYCNKKEVIVTLKDKSTQCLDPNGKFTQAVLKIKLIQMAQHAAKMKATSPKTTITSAAIWPTSS